MITRRLWFRAGISLVAAIVAATACLLIATPDNESLQAADRKRRTVDSTSTTTTTTTRTPYTVLGYPELGMHMMTQDFSEMCILPPFSTLRAQVIDRVTEDHPRIVTERVSVSYSIPGNTTSSNKTNFWQFSDQLFKSSPHLPPDVGLTGSTLKGLMVSTEADDWVVKGIPATQLTDAFQNNTTQLSSIVVRDNATGKTLATTKAVVPVSWDVNCGSCHNTPGISVATDILRKHDSKHGTNLEQAKPVLCANCHADPFLGKPGVANVKALSHSIHDSHFALMSALPDLKNKCLACHPPSQPRDPHKTAGMSCADCHGDMKAVGNTSRHPWVDQPTCAQCHQKIKPNFDFEEPGKLFKDSKGHGGIYCAACHGPQHAVGVSTNAADNAQAILQQGHAGVINDCTVCHSKTPEDPFPHKRDD